MIKKRELRSIFTFMFRNRNTPDFSHGLQTISVISIIILVIGLFFIGKPTITGLVIYEEHYYIKNWSFDEPYDYIYDDSLIEIVNGETKLIPTISYIYWNTSTQTDYFITAALYNPDDKTDRINTLDNEKHELDHNKITDIFFNENLDNGDIVSIYIKSGSETDIFLCEKGTFCDAPGYGSVDYDGEEGWYNITIDGLDSPTKIFNLASNKDFKIDYITSTKGDVIKGLFKPDDKTSKVESLDNEKVEIDKAKLLNLIFDNQINNGDIISLYIKSGSETDIFLCDYGIECGAPGYGSVSYDGEEGWYNITVNGLSSPTNSFNLDPIKVKIDYIKAIHIEYEEHSSSNITYPSSAEIETNDIEIEDLLGFDLFSKEELLNAQTINYYYSVDSGLNWNDVPESGNLSSIDTSNGKIRIKAVLNSNGDNTPILSNIAVSYSTQTIVCSENWDVVYGECLANDAKLKSYIDSNNCGSNDGLPADNGTYVSCDYCTPNWVEVNTSCQPDSTITEYYIDSNNCYAITGFGSDNNPPDNNTYSCDYIISTKFKGDSTDFSAVNSPNLTNPVLEVPSYGKINFSGTININQSIDLDSNIEITNNSIFVNSTALPEFNKSAVLSFYNLSFINPIILKDGSECSSLICTKIGYTNGTLVFNVTHFTTYSTSEGPYCGDNACNGDETCSSCSADCGSCSQSSRGSSGGGGGGGSRARRTPIVVKKPTKEEISEEEIIDEVVKETKSEEIVCDYVIDISLVNEISFIEKNSFDGEVVNKGNCDIENLNLDLSPNLGEIAYLSDPHLKNIKMGDKAVFSLIKKIEDKKENLLTGAVTKTSKYNEIITGNLIFEGIINGTSILKKEISLNVEILNQKDIIDKKRVAFIGLTVFLVISFICFIKIKKKKGS